VRPPRVSSLLVAVCLAAAASCAKTATCDQTADCVTGPIPSVGEEFELAPLGSVTVTGTLIRITFERVADDSRCPTDAVCVWAGSVGLDIVVTDNGVEKFKGRLNSNQAPKVVSVGAYELSIVGVTPAPRTTTTIRPEDYRARMKLAAK
jgi:hypothetical protein